MSKIIQIVSFNVPYPPNYGGVIDVFFKIKSLHELGYEIILHAFDYGRGEQKELTKYCKQVYYYRRKKLFTHLLSPLPFIVISRKNKNLLINLNKHDGCIIFEGIHTTYWVYKNALKNHQVIVRTHNIEYLYYQGLSITEKNIFKRFYFLLESHKLRKYELQALANADYIATISPNDKAYFKQYFTNVALIYPFHGNNEVTCKPGKGNYILIHGDLSVPENIHSVVWLLEHVISKIKYKTIIAGNKPNEQILQSIKKYEHISLICNPSSEEIDNLITEAHIHIIHSFYPQGMKLKLLNSLYKGRFVIANQAVVANTGMEQLCYIANEKEDFLINISMLMQINFEETHIQQRKELLTTCSTKEQAIRLTQLF
ncbi:MAG: glycosyltransferase [Bacteroidales bacterium]|nr:glycosyltransferase [Bacteroidales bacterium]